MSRLAVITGVAGGIGSAAACEFALEGWDVIGLDRRLPPPELPLSRFLQADFADSVSTAEALDRVLETEESLDALVNNAGVLLSSRLVDTTIAQWDSVMAVNVRAAFQGMQSLWPLLAEVGGSIVNVSSVHAVATSSGLGVYAASKGALAALTRAAAVELAPDGIRVNAVLPGAVDTPMLRAGLRTDGLEEGPDDALLRLQARTPLQRVAEPSEVARSIVFLADRRRSGFVTGQSLVIDGGATARLATE